MKYAAWLCALLSVAACRSEDSPPSGLQNPVDILSRSQRHAAGRHSKHELGRRVYNFRCYYCHGYSGDARTVASGYLNPKPRDFTRTHPGRVTPERMLDAVTHGRPNTAMKAFAGILTQSEIEAVVDFVRQEFMLAKAMNTRYHTKENGWPDHARYRAAFPFALGEIPLATPWEELNAEQQAGKRLFMSSCLTCHERGNDAQTNHVTWDPRPLSFPRGGYTASRSLGIDAMTSPS
ncbi:MAG: cytochrome c, partial [Pseudomonadota bacterium]|nr:cytochrome c [Pseudomonadota bacterium]